MTALAAPGPGGDLAALRFALQLLKDPRRTLADNTRRHGPVWQTRIPGGGRGLAGLVPLFFLMGPAGNERILAPPYRDDFSWYEGYALTMRPLFGPDILLLLDDTAEDPAHRARHRVLVPAFHPRLDEAYLDVMRAIATDRLARWPAAGELDLMQEIKQLTFHIVVRLLFGAADTELPALFHHFEELGLGLYSTLHVNLPGFRFRRGVKAHAWLLSYLGDKLRRYRAAGEEPANMLGNLLRNQRETGDVISDATLCGEMIAFVYAGYDTTASLLTSFFACLLGRDDIHEAVAREADSLSVYTLAAMQGLPLQEAALAETERLCPPLTFGLRGVRRGFQFAGYDIPAGSKVGYSSYCTGRMPEVFPDPDRYLPERFLGEGRPPPYSLIGFGAGHRACIGKRFANLEIRLLLNLILGRHRLRLLPGQSDEMFFNPAMQRRHGLRVAVSRR